MPCLFFGLERTEPTRLQSRFQSCRCHYTFRLVVCVQWRKQTDIGCVRKSLVYTLLHPHWDNASSLVRQLGKVIHKEIHVMLLFCLAQLQSRRACNTVSSCIPQMPHKGESRALLLYSIELVFNLFHLACQINIEVRIGHLVFHTRFHWTLSEESSSCKRE